MRVERIITTWQALIVIDCVLEWALTKNPTPGDQRSEVRPDSFIYRSPRHLGVERLTFRFRFMRARHITDDGNSIA